MKSLNPGYIPVTALFPSFDKNFLITEWSIISPLSLVKWFIITSWLMDFLQETGNNGFRTGNKIHVNA